MTEPNETGFDGRLRTLATTLMDRDAPGFDVFPGRAWHEDSLFRTMQTFAAIKAFTGTPEDMAACEKLGRVKVELLKERQVI